MPTEFLLIETAGRRQLIELSRIREIIAMMALAESDVCTGWCRGMANLRGEIIPVFDATSPRAPLAPTRSIVICPIDDGAAGVVVDDVHNVVAVAREHVVSRATGGSRTARFARIDGEVLAIVDPCDIVRRETMTAPERLEAGVGARKEAADGGG